MVRHNGWGTWLAGWLGLLVMAIANGALRVLVTQPHWGEEIARRVATAILLLAVGVYVSLFERQHHLPSAQKAWAVGLVWAGLTLSFEFGFGLATGLSWSQMLADYGVTRGRIWILVPAFIAMAPWLARAIRLRRRQAM